MSAIIRKELAIELADRLRVKLAPTFAEIVDTSPSKERQFAATFTASMDGVECECIVSFCFKERESGNA